MTSLYDNIIFGPVRSRRLGISLGVNLLPIESKLCSFDCIYCECGWNADHPGKRRFNAREDVYKMLDETLGKMVKEGTPPDVITFAGNGEPTMHPDFEAIIEDTRALHDKHCPNAKVSVLSNATQIHREDVRRALKRVDNNILKLDSAFDATVQLMNKPQGNYTVARTVELLKMFEGDFIMQTMFLRFPGFSTAEPENLKAWMDIVRETKPREVMVYTLDREAPAQGLEQFTVDEMREAVKPLVDEGFTVQIKG